MGGGGGGGLRSELERENVGLRSELERESGGLRNWLAGTLFKNAGSAPDGGKNKQWSHEGEIKFDFVIQSCSAVMILIHSDNMRGKLTCM